MDMRLILWACFLVLPLSSTGAQTNSSGQQQQGFLKEYLRMVHDELQQYQECPDCPGDLYHYLRPVTDIRGGLIWITQPFYPEAYGIEAPEEHPVMAYMQKELLSTEHPVDKSLLYLIETPEQLQRLRQLIKLYSLN